MPSYIISGARTPIGKLLGKLSSAAAPQLGAIAVREAVHRSRLDAGQIDEVILGNVLQAGVGQAPARQAALQAGLPPQIPALTINKVCGSGLKAVMLADQSIRSGDASIVVAGGMESMSRAPHLLLGSRTGRKYGSQELVDAMIWDGLRCSTEHASMGELAEATAQEYSITRTAQDEFAAESHHRALLAMETGKFAQELVPVSVGSGAGPVVSDEGPRADATCEKLRQLPTAFSAAGTITAGNSSQISDGAAAVVVVSDRIARAADTPWRARIVASAVSGVEPRQLFIAPVSAIEKVLAQSRLTPRDIDLLELNEAFAAQCLACLQQLKWPLEQANVHGGAIALGHPIGASGARVLVTLIHALVQRKLRRGLAALCLGGGNAVAMIIELE